MAMETSPKEQPNTEETYASVDRLAVGASISLVGAFLGRGIDFVKQIAMARLLGPDIFGLYAIGWNLLRILGIFAPLGLQNGVIHFGSALWRKDEGALRSVIIRSLVLSFVIGWLLTILLFILSPWIAAELFREPEFALYLRVFSLMLPFMGTLRVSANASRISQRMQYATATEEIAQATINLILFIAFYLIGWELFGAIVATVLSFIIAFGLSLYYLHRLFRTTFQASSRRTISNSEIMAYSVPTALAGMFGMLINRIDRLFLGFFWSSAEVGIYQAAAQFTIILEMVLNAFNMILMPMVVELFNKNEMNRLEELYRINTKWGIYAIIPIVLLIVFAAQDLITIVFGSAYITGASALIILTVGQFINIATGGTGTILIMTGYQTTWFRLSGLFAGINFLLNLALVPRLEMIGAATATATTVGGLFLISLLLVYRIHRLWPYDRRYLKGVVAATITVLILLGVRLLNLPPLMNLIMSGLVASVGFLGCLVVLGLDPEDRAFIDLLVKRVRPR